MRKEREARLDEEDEARKTETWETEGIKSSMKLDETPSAYPFAMSAPDTLVRNRLHP